MTGPAVSTVADVAELARNLRMTASTFTPGLYGCWELGQVELLVRDDLAGSVQVYVRADGRETRFTAGWPVEAVDAVLRAALADSPAAPS